MKFSLKQLQVFQLVAERQSVSDAAKELFMSQSAASMALAQLESQLGNPLFVREGRRMTLTHWGQWLRPHVHTLLANCHTIEMGMQDRDLISGQLDIGASQTPAEYLLPELFAKMDASFPHLHLTLQVENTEHVLEGLLDYRYDLGIIEGYCDHPEIARKVWCKDELVIVASSNHPYAKLNKTSLTQLEMADWILREPGAGTREVFDASIHKYIEQVKVHRVYDHAGVILAMVAGGPYLTCISQRLANPWVEQGKLVVLNVEELIMHRNFSFVWRKQQGEESRREALIKMAETLVFNYQ